MTAEQSLHNHIETMNRIELRNEITRRVDSVLDDPEKAHRLYVKIKEVLNG